MAGVIYLSLLEVIELHTQVMERTGFAPAPLRDEGALESAVMRPQMAAHYEDADLIRQATLLMVGISQSQAFVDGNKRTAFAAADVFLRINGHKIPAEVSMEAAKQLEAVAERESTLAEATDQFEAWLRAHVTPR